MNIHKQVIRGKQATQQQRDSDARHFSQRIQALEMELEQMPELAKDLAQAQGEVARLYHLHQQAGICDLITRSNENGGSSETTDKGPELHM